jgi:hypothetical protein
MDENALFRYLGNPFVFEMFGYVDRTHRVEQIAV